MCHQFWVNLLLTSGKHAKTTRAVQFIIVGNNLAFLFPVAGFFNNLNRMMRELDQAHLACRTLKGPFSCDSKKTVSVWLSNMSVQLTNVSVRLYINVSTFICQWEGVTCYIVQWWQTQIWLPYKKYGQHTKSMITIPEVWSIHHKYGQNTRNIVNIPEIWSTYLDFDDGHFFPTMGW